MVISAASVIKVFGVQSSSPGEPESLLLGFDIYGLVEFFDLLGDLRDVLGHLSAGPVLNEVDRFDPAADGTEASSGCFPRRFAEGDDVSLALHRCADDLLGILVKSSRLLSHQVSVDLFQLQLCFPELLTFGAPPSLGVRTDG